MPLLYKYGKHNKGTVYGNSRKEAKSRFKGQQRITAQTGSNIAVLKEERKKERLSFDLVAWVRVCTAGPGYSTLIKTCERSLTGFIASKYYVPPYKI